MPELPEGVQQYLWEADQLSYEPPGSGPREDGAELLAPLGEYIALADLSKLHKAWEERLLSEEGLRAAVEAFERLPDGTQFRERLTRLPEYGESVVPPRELARTLLQAAIQATRGELGDQS